MKAPVSKLHASPRVTFLFCVLKRMLRGRVCTACRLLERFGFFLEKEEEKEEQQQEKEEPGRSTLHAQRGHRTHITHAAHTALVVLVLCSTSPV